MLHPYHQGEIKGKDALFQELDKNPHFATSLTDLQTAGVNSKGDVYKIALGSGPDGGPSGQITVTAVPDIRGKGDRFTISYKLDGLNDHYLSERHKLTADGLNAEGRPVTYTAQEALMKTLAAVREIERQLVKKPLESADVVEEPEEEVEPGYKVDRLEAEAEAKAEETKTESPEAEAKPLETAAEEKTETATEPATTLAEGDVVPATAETVFANRGYGFALCEGAEVFFHAHRSAAPQFDAEGNLTGWSKVAPDSGRIEMPDEKSNLVIHVQKQPDSSKRAGYVAAAWCTREQYDAARDEAMSAAAA
jgi:hypothetical protein